MHRLFAAFDVTYTIMFLLLLGLGLLLFGSLTQRSTKNPVVPRILMGVGVVMVILGISTSTVKIIEPGQSGVQKLFGKVQDGVLTEGLNVVNPFVDVVEFDVRTQSYTMSGVHDEGDKGGDDAIRVLTSDGLEVVIDLTVLYSLPAANAPKVLQTIGADYNNKIVRPITRTRIRDNAVYYDAISLYSTKREEFQQRIYNTIQKDFRSRGLELEQLLIRNITLPQSVKETIEGKINAEQEAQKMQFVLQKERQEAERKRVEAQGRADAQRILSSTLSDRLLQYEQIQMQKELAASPNAKVVIMGGGKSPAILLNQ